MYTIYNATMIFNNNIYYILIYLNTQKQWAGNRNLRAKHRCLSD